MQSILHRLNAIVTLTIAPLHAAEKFDVVVYGGTPGGITSAISASMEGLSVVLLEQTKHVGGLSTSGLNRDELEHMDRKTMGGLSEKFLNEAARRSRVPPKPEGYITPGPRVWQSHIAEKVFLEMLEEAKVPVRFEQLLDGVTKKDGRITELTVGGGTIYKAKIFIDATYEGDLMAAAGVSYALGREASDTYDESLGGVRYLDEKIKVSPYDEDGKLLPGIMPGPPPVAYSTSPHPLCYNIRLNLATQPENSVPIKKPENYDPMQFELLARSLASGQLKRAGQIFGFYGMPGGKKECNNTQFSIVSMSMPGEQTAWSEASFEEREAIHKKYRDYTHGLLWFLKSDPRVPDSIREEMAGYGLCKDEWADNGHWPYYLYIRAARRMKSDYIMTQRDITEDRDKQDVIHIGSHYIDSHHVARYAYDKDHFINEGRIWEKGRNFDIPYRAITPKAEECRNLLVPVCVSSSAVAFCAIRLEPTWMHLGEVSGMAASLAIREEKGVQDIDGKELQKKITKAGIPLEVPDPAQGSVGPFENGDVHTHPALAGILDEVVKQQRPGGYYCASGTIDWQQPIDYVNERSPGSGGRMLPALWGNSRMLCGLVEAMRAFPGHSGVSAAARRLGEYTSAGSYAAGHITCWFPAMEGLVKLGTLTGERKYIDAAKQMATFYERFDRLPIDHAHGMLCCQVSLLLLYEETKDSAYGPKLLAVEGVDARTPAWPLKPEDLDRNGLKPLPPAFRNKNCRFVHGIGE